MRILIAGILGGIGMFIWTSVAHMFLNLGAAGISEIPNESAVLSAMQSNIGEKSGLYIFPGLGVGENATREQKNEAMKTAIEKYTTNPSGLLVYHPPGRVFAMGSLLGIEFAKEAVVAILAVFLLAQTTIASFAGRVGFIFVVGILAAITTNVSYWNWYGFPSTYILAYMSIEIVGFLCAGFLAALVLGRRTA
jgi:hypothetical protein